MHVHEIHSKFMYQRWAIVHVDLNSTKWQILFLFPLFCCLNEICIPTYIDSCTMYCKYMNVSTHLEPDENIYKVCMQLHVVEPKCKMMNQIDFVFFFYLMGSTLYVFIYTGKLCHRGKCHSGNCHSGDRWMSRPFVHSVNLNFKHTLTNDLVFHNAWKRIICHFIT